MCLEQRALHALMCHFVQPAKHRWDSHHLPADLRTQRPQLCHDVVGILFRDYKRTVRCGARQNSSLTYLEKARYRGSIGCRALISNSNLFKRPCALMAPWYCRARRPRNRKIASLVRSRSIVESTTSSGASFCQRRILRIILLGISLSSSSSGSALRKVVFAV